MFLKWLFIFCRQDCSNSSTLIMDPDPDPPDPLPFVNLQLPEPHPPRSAPSPATPSINTQIRPLQRLSYPSMGLSPALSQVLARSTLSLPTRQRIHPRLAHAWQAATPAPPAQPQLVSDHPGAGSHYYSDGRGWGNPGRALAAVVRSAPPPPADPSSTSLSFSVVGYRAPSPSATPRATPSAARPGSAAATHLPPPAPRSSPMTVVQLMEDESLVLIEDVSEGEDEAEEDDNEVAPTMAARTPFQSPGPQMPDALAAATSLGANTGCWLRAVPPPPSLPPGHAARPRVLV